MGMPSDGILHAHMQNVVDMTTPQRGERILREHGYDGVHYKAMVGSRVTGGIRPLSESDSWVVFDPKQIAILDPSAQP